MTEVSAATIRQVTASQVRRQVMATITVEHRRDGPFTVEVGDHPMAIGESGLDLDAAGAAGGPSENDMFVAAVAIGVAAEARRYLSRYHRSTDGLRVTADYTLSNHWPRRLTAIELTLSLPTELPIGWAQALHAIAVNTPAYTALSPETRTAVWITCGSGPHGYGPNADSGPVSPPDPPPPRAATGRTAVSAGTERP
jgi:hypothetical protein